MAELSRLPQLPAEQLFLAELSRLPQLPAAQLSLAALSRLSQLPAAQLSLAGLSRLPQFPAAQLSLVGLSRLPKIPTAQPNTEMKHSGSRAKNRMKLYVGSKVYVKLSGILIGDPLQLKEALICHTLY